MSDVELGQAALSTACAALTAPAGTLHGSLYRQQLSEIEHERSSRGLCEIAWFEQARAELQFRFPPEPKGKPRRQLDVDLAGVPPAAIASTAVLLARAAAIASKAGETDTSGILASFAQALDAHVPDTPRRRGRSSPALN
jgi:hypothetical protein